jgi:hypothetical protein
MKTYLLISLKYHWFFLLTILLSHYDDMACCMVTRCYDYNQMWKLTIITWVILNWTSQFCKPKYSYTIWFIAKTQKTLKIPNEFQWKTKYVFWQNYFLHMWHAPKVRHFEPIEHNYFVKWLKTWVLCLVTLSFKISKLWYFCMIWFFIKFIQWTCIFIEGGMFLLYKKFEINCMTLCIPFDPFSLKV